MTVDRELAPRLPADVPTVLHVLEAVGGGTAQHLLDIVRHVDGVEHHAAVPARRTGGLSDEKIVHRLRASGAHVHVVPMRRMPLSLDNMAATRHLRRLIGVLRPDIVHGHSSIGGALARLATVGSDTRFVWTPHAVAPGAALRRVQAALYRRADLVIAVSPS